MGTSTTTRRGPTRQAIDGRDRHGRVGRLPQSSEDTSVRDALDRFSARQARGGPETPQPGSSAPSRTAVRSAWSRAVFLVVVVAGVVLVSGLIRAASATPGPSCEPITYSVQGSPPAHALGELGLALREIHERSGLVFEAGGPDPVKLVVTWSDRPLSRGGSSPSGSVQSGWRRVGSGGGTWRTVHGGRELVAAEIAMDGTASWHLGLDRNEGLASVFIHELGHAVIGMAHSPDPASFMYGHTSPERPRWTAHDLDELARAGQLSGCRAPQSPM